MASVRNTTMMAVWGQGIYYHVFIYFSYGYKDDHCQEYIYDGCLVAEICYLIFIYF